MPDAPKETISAAEFRCKFCSKIAKVLRDWQRCWQCCLASTSRNTITYPSICEACHAQKHPKAFDLI